MYLRLELAVTSRYSKKIPGDHSPGTSTNLYPTPHIALLYSCLQLYPVPFRLTLLTSSIYVLFLFDTHYILCYYNLVFEFLCHPEMGVWAIHPGHMLFKLENRVIIMPFFTAL